MTDPRVEIVARGYDEIPDPFAETNRRPLAEAGFELVRDEVATIREPEGAASFHWVPARR